MSSESVPQAEAGGGADHADFEFELSDRQVAFDVSEELYNLDAIYSAAYLFIGRCYVFLDRPADRQVRVRLRTKEKADEEALEALAGEFANELLNSQLRVTLSRATATIREQYMARAFFAPQQNATIAELLAELDEEEMEEESLEIAVPWEQTDSDGEQSDATP